LGVRATVPSKVVWVPNKPQRAKSAAAAAAAAAAFAVQKVEKCSSRIWP
jgi:hypothetical protein